MHASPSADIIHLCLLTEIYTGCAQVHCLRVNNSTVLSSAPIPCSSVRCVQTQTLRPSEKGASVNLSYITSHININTQAPVQDDITQQKRRGRAQANPDSPLLNEKGISVKFHIQRLLRPLIELMTCSNTLLSPKLLR